MAPMPKRRAPGLAAVAALTAGGRHDRLVALKMLRRVPEAR